MDAGIQHLSMKSIVSLLDWVVLNFVYGHCCFRGVEHLLTLVSGDSSGSVQFWDSCHGTLLQAHTYHKGNVNALAAMEDLELTMRSYRLMTEQNRSGTSFVCNSIGKSKVTAPCLAMISGTSLVTTQ